MNSWSRLPWLLPLLLLLPPGTGSAGLSGDGSADESCLLQHRREAVTVNRNNHNNNNKACSDAVTWLPQVGNVRGRQYAGFATANATLRHHLFYWFVEAASGSEAGITPLLVWMNGGPGESSLVGLLSEYIGPVNVGADGAFRANPHAWTEHFNVIAVDSPVGTGYSYTESDTYVSSEEEMRSDYYTALQYFFQRHPEYESNPLWIVGESYGGKFVPNVAYEIHRHGRLNLKGIIMGNGLYSARLQYSTVLDYASAHGFIAAKAAELAKPLMTRCTSLIEQGANEEAYTACNQAVWWVYHNDSAGGGVFYTDISKANSSAQNAVFAVLTSYLNDPATREALHAGSREWLNENETWYNAPVGNALKADWVTEQGMRMIERLLDAGKGYRAVTYNGMLDGAFTNHLGNRAVMDALEWHGKASYAAAATEPWKPGGVLAGYRRSAGALSYYTVRFAGHMVAQGAPEAMLALLQETTGPA